MNFFGVGAGELLFLLILGLLIIGPERLPEIARSLGQMIARLMVWQQSSPEVQMFTSLRQDFEREIKEVRDELVQTQQKLQQNFQALQTESQSMQQHLSNLAVDPTRHASQQERPTPVPTSKRPNQAQQPNRLGEAQPNLEVSQATTQHNGTSDESVASASDSPPASASDSPPASTSDSPPDSPTPMGQPTSLAQQPSNVASTAIAHDPDVPLLQAQIQTLYTELHSLNAQLRHTGLLDGEWNPRLQIETLMADVHALQQQLQERGYLSPEWKPPSHMSQAHTNHTNVAHD